MSAEPPKKPAGGPTRKRTDCVRRQSVLRRTRARGPRKRPAEKSRRRRREAAPNRKRASARKKRHNGARRRNRGARSPNGLAKRRPRKLQRWLQRAKSV